MLKALCTLVVGTSLVVVAACSKPAQPAPTLEEPPPAATPEPVPTPAEVATPAPPPPAELVLETVYFDFDSYSLNGQAQDTLRKVATAMRSNANVKVQIEGHADDRGSNEYNLALGERRAQAVQQFLVSEGIAAGDLSTISYGEERPAQQGSGEDAWSRNRRAEFRRL